MSLSTRLATRPRHAALLAFTVAAMSVAAAGPADAVDTWTRPYTGIRHLHRVTTAPLDLHALVVDLCAPGVSIRATTSTERRRTVSSFGTLVRAEAAVNGDFFSFSTYLTSGLAMGNGVRWGGNDDGYNALLAFGPAMADFSDGRETVSTPAPWMRQIVSGHPQIVNNGVAAASFGCTTSGDPCNRNPRTAAGLSLDMRTLYVAVVDGRSTRSRGMTMAELGSFIRALGAYEAVNFDGGGSSAMWLRSAGLITRPSDGSERVVSNHLGIHANGTGAPGSCIPIALPDAGVLRDAGVSRDVALDVGSARDAGVQDAELAPDVEAIEDDVTVPPEDALELEDGGVEDDVMEDTGAGADTHAGRRSDGGDAGTGGGMQPGCGCSAAGNASNPTAAGAALAALLMIWMHRRGRSARVLLARQRLTARGTRD